jgi:RNA polymerase sigma factor for flagellar operon FliA
LSDSDLELWKQYKATGDPHAKEDLILKYASFVKYVAGRIAMNLPDSVEFDDLVGYGIFGLIDAINKFNPERQVKFKTYAQTRIRGAIFDELRVLDWTPRSIRQKARELERTLVKIENDKGRAATDEEICLEMGISMKELQRVYNDTRGALLLSLDEICFDSENTSARMNFIENEKIDNPQESIEKLELKDLLADAIDKLSEREKLVVTLYYYEELTLKEIGKIIGVSDSRVSQLHTKAVSKLRGRLSKIKQELTE